MLIPEYLEILYLAENISYFKGFLSARVVEISALVFSQEILDTIDLVYWIEYNSKFVTENSLGKWKTDVRCHVIEYMYPYNKVHHCRPIVLQLMRKNNELKVIGFSHNSWNAVLWNLVQFIGFHSKIRMTDAWRLEDLSLEVKTAPKLYVNVSWYNKYWTLSWMTSSSCILIFIAVIWHSKIYYSSKFEKKNQSL